MPKPILGVAYHAEDVRRLLQELRNPLKAKILQGFFKTGKGEYGEGDLFLGITVPLQRQVARKFLALSLSEVEKLLHSQVHEHRFTALEILVMQYEKGSEAEREKIVRFYLRQTKHVNNWDLVDTSAKYILGHYLFTRERKILYKLVKSKSLWERRIAIIATHYFIDQKDFSDTLLISKLLLRDREDLIHKAVGWMLREVGKKSRSTLEGFLKTHAKEMPRVMLRYALEHFSKTERRVYLRA